MASFSSTTTGGFFSSPRAQRRLFWVSGGVLVVGVVTFISVFVLRGQPSIPQSFHGKPQFAPHLKKAPPPRVAYTIARKFIETAPERKNLAAAYQLVDNEIKGNQTLKQWETGNIAVDPYKAQNVKTAAFTIDWSYTNQILFDIVLIPTPGTQAPNTPSQIDWYIGLKKTPGKHGRWLVNYWLPNWHPPVQLGQGGN